MTSIKFIRQHDAMDCGPTCLKMIAQFYGHHYSLETLREYSHITREGVSMLGISDAAEAIGFRTIAIKTDYDNLVNEQPVPFIAHWNQEHFVVVYKLEKDKIWVADPAHGKISYTRGEFIKSWASTVKKNVPQGVCLLLEPTPEFYNREEEPLQKNGFSFLLKYLKPHKKFIIQLILGLFVGSLLQLVFPFLTQAVVDKGINRLMASGYIHLSAIQKGVFMDTLSNKQSIGACILDLAQGYKKKFGISDGKFILKACKTVLKYHPNNTNALLLQAETQIDMWKSSNMQSKKQKQNDFQEVQKIYTQIHNLGYRMMPKEMYFDWLASLKKQKQKYQNKKINLNTK